MNDGPFRETVRFGPRTARLLAAGASLAAAALVSHRGHAAALAQGLTGLSVAAVVLALATRRGEVHVSRDELMIRVGPVVRSVAPRAILAVTLDEGAAPAPTDRVDVVWAWLAAGERRVLVLSRDGGEERVTVVPTGDPRRLRAAIQAVQGRPGADVEARRASSLLSRPSRQLRERPTIDCVVSSVCARPIASSSPSWWGSPR